MEANNFNPMMMGMNPMNNMNQMEINMNQINNMNLMMMAMMNPFGIGENTMNNNMMNFPNNPLMNDLNNEQNLNSKNIRLFYGCEFITNVTITKDERENIEKLKSILFSFGKKTYRPPHKGETIEREHPYETLEFLIERGVVELYPRLIIKNITRYRNYYLTGFDFNHVQNGDSLQVEFEGKTYGAGGLCDLEFINIDKLTKTKKLAFSKDAPKWRNISIGLNLFGKCINKNCKAFNQEVIYPVGINIKFDLTSRRKEIKCPICSKNFLPVTMGFWKCEYQIKGEKFKNGEYEEINLNGKETVGDNFEYYDQNKNKVVSWSYLSVFTGYRQKMKYKEK